MRLSLIIGGLLLGLMVGGCGHGKPIEPIVRKDPAVVIARLKSELAQVRRTNQEMSQQLDILRGFGDDRLEYLVRVEKIGFGRFTRIADKSEGTGQEGLIVYLVLRDRQGSKIKAAGEVEIELWDLSNDNGRRLGQWKFTLKEQPKYWLSGVLTDHYKFKLGVLDNLTDKTAHPAGPTNFTLKCRFTEALTGTVFEAQKMLTVNG